MKKLLLLLIIPFLSFGQDFKETVLGSCSAKQFILKQTDENKYVLYMESNRRITKGGWSDRRQNYTSKKIEFNNTDISLNELYNALNEMLEKQEKGIIQFGKNKLKIAPTDFSSIKLTYKGVQNYLSKSDLNLLFKQILN